LGGVREQTLASMPLSLAYSSFKKLLIHVLDKTYNHH